MTCLGLQLKKLVWNDMSWVTIKETLSNIHLIISLQQLDLNGYDP